MLKREKYIAAHIQSSFRVRLYLMLLDEIKKHQQNEEGLWGEYTTIIEDLSLKIRNKKLTRYELGEEFVVKEYGIPEGVTSFLICDLAFYHAGCEAIKQAPTPTFNYLEYIEEDMDGAFFIGYKPDKEALSRLVTQLDGMAMEVASKSRDIDRQKGALERFCQELDKIENEDEIIKQINYYNDGSYMELWGTVSCLAHFLMVDEVWDGFYRLLEVLKYFPMQGGAIRLLRSASDVEAVIEKVFEQNGRKSIHYLLREQWFHLICKEGSILKGNSEIVELNDEDKNYIADLYKVFENSKPQSVKNVVSIWQQVFGKEDLAVWISDKSIEAKRKHEKYGKPELELLKLLSAEINVTGDDVKGFALKNKSFAALLTFAESVTDASVAGSVVEEIANKLFSDCSYPDTLLTEQWFEQARIVYRCLNKSGCDGLDLMLKRRKPLEGFRVDLGQAMRGVSQEAYWLAVLLLSLEESGDETLFGKYVDVLFRDTRYCINSLTDDVFTPYYVAEMLVSQVMTGQKDGYEKKLIEGIPYLVFVIRVLTANQGVMSTEVKELLTTRICKEWPLERKLLSQYKMAKIAFYDEFVKKFMQGC
jgi:hypothetical protein